LTGDDTCTNGIVTAGNQSLILNQSGANYIKNLLNDNRLIREIMCYTILNETIKK